MLAQPLQGGVRTSQNIKVAANTGDIVQTEAHEDSSNKLDVSPAMAYLNSQPSMAKLRRSQHGNIASTSSLRTSE